MPNTHAAEKDLRKSQRRAERNLRLKTHLKQLVKNAKELLAEKKFAEAKVAAAKLQQIADKAAKRRVVSVQSSRRRKSGVMKQLAAQTKA